MARPGGGFGSGGSCRLTIACEAHDAASPADPADRDRDRSGRLDSRAQVQARDGCGPSSGRREPTSMRGGSTSRGDAWSELSRRSPGRGDVEYLLGLCARFENNPEAALAAWGRVPRDAAGSRPARHSRRGRWRSKTADTRWPNLPRAGQPRREEHRRSKHADCSDGSTGSPGGMTTTSGYLRSQAERREEPFRDAAYALERRDRRLPDRRDAAGGREGPCRRTRRRPGLAALADVATRSGRFDEASDWLSRCEQARPQRSRPSGRHGSDGPRPPTDRMRSCALPGTSPSPSISKPRVLELRAWLAARIGDERLERTSLEELLELEPADTAALDRLTDIAARKGDLKTVAELRQRKANIDAIRERYRALTNLTDLSPKAVELARAAEGLGRRFDARAWWRLAASLDPTAESEAEAALKRLKPEEPATEAGSDECSPRCCPGFRRVRQRRPWLPAASRIPVFADVAAARGLVFTFDNGRSEQRQLPETMSGGVAVLDFDGDGWLDVYAVQGGPFPAAEARPPFGDRLFRNLGDGRFKDVTASVRARHSAGRLRPRNRRGRLRQRRPARPVRDAVGVVRALSQPGERPVRRRHGAGGAGRTARLPDLGGLGRPRQRRRSRSLCLPLSEVGRRESARSARTRRGPATRTATRGISRRCPITSFGTTGADLST